MTKGLTLVRNCWVGSWRWTVVGAAYLLGLLVIGNLVFGASTLFVQRPSGAARTGAYSSGLPVAAAVNPDTIGKAISEAGGGPPTIGLPLPEALPAVAAAPAKPDKPKKTAVALVSKRMIAKTTPTYKAMVKTATSPNLTLLLALIQSYLRSQPTARPDKD